MASITQQDVGKITEDMKGFYEPGNEACGKTTPAQMRLLLERLSDYTKQVKQAAVEHKLVTEWSDPWTGELHSTGSEYNPMWAIDMANWEQRLAHYLRVVEDVSDEDATTVGGCEMIYKQVTAPLLDGIYYEVLKGTNLNDEERARMASGTGHPSLDVVTTLGGKDHPGGHSNAKPPDVISPFTLGNQVLVWKDHQDERMRQFWADLKQGALNLPQTIADAAEKALGKAGRDFLMPLGIALLGVSAVAVTGLVIVQHVKANKLKREMEGSRALNPGKEKLPKKSGDLVVVQAHGKSLKVKKSRPGTYFLQIDGQNRSRWGDAVEARSDIAYFRSTGSFPPAETGWQ